MSDSPRDFLSPKGRELLERNRKGYDEGKVEYPLYRDIESILLDSHEAHNDKIERDLEERGA